LVLASNIAWSIFKRKKKEKIVLGSGSETQNNTSRPRFKSVAYEDEKDYYLHYKEFKKKYDIP
jgi:hypothetical protein